MRDVRLITMTLDPEFDTPAVLGRHAARLNANPAIWSFVTGEPEAAGRFARQFGILRKSDPAAAQTSRTTSEPPSSTPKDGW